MDFTEVVYHKEKEIYEQSFKIISYLRKIKNTAKNQSFPRTYRLSTIKLHKIQVSQKSQNSYIINQKNPFLGPKWAKQEGYCYNFYTVKGFTSYYIYKFDNALTFKLKSISLFWYLDNFLEKDETRLSFEINIA